MFQPYCGIPRGNGPGSCSWCCSLQISAIFLQCLRPVQCNDSKRCGTLRFFDIWFCLFLPSSDFSLPLSLQTTNQSRGWFLLVPPESKSFVKQKQSRTESRRPAELVPKVGEEEVCPVGKVKVDFCKANPERDSWLWLFKVELYSNAISFKKNNVVKQCIRMMLKLASR